MKHRLSLVASAALLPLVVACGVDAGPTASGGLPVPTAQNQIDPPTGPGTDGTSTGGTTSPASPGPSTPASLATCTAQPACTGATGPTLAAPRAFNHFLGSATAASGPAFHRGRDQIISVGDPQWVIGHMTYTYVDKDLLDEDVDIFLERSCAGTWEKLGATRTTDNNTAHESVEGVEDHGGRVYFQIPNGQELAAGRHRIRLVVAADQTSTDLLIDVVPKGSPIVVTDVDGTLTDSETAEFPALLSGVLPAAQPRAAETLSALASKGYHVVYLTSRPEWLTGRTREFLANETFPPGIIHTTSGESGAVNASAAVFKSADLALLQSHGHKIEWAFGNQPSDGDAYDSAKIEPLDQRVFLRLTDPHGGRRIEAFSEIVPAVSATPATCK